MAYNWYVGRELVKRAANLQGSERDSIIDAAIEAASREIDGPVTNRRFIPITATRNYPWPQPEGRRVYVVHLDEDLLSVSALTKEGDDVTALAAADFFLEPANFTPYSRIEIDLASTAFFSAKDTHQRQIRVTGSWGYGNDTVTAGTVASGLASDAAAVSMVISNGGIVEVGYTLLIGTEQVFVSAKTFAALGSILLNDTLTADVTDVTVTVDGSHGIVAGETIQVESERMYVLSVNSNDLSVIRAYDGTALAAHANDTAVQINRTCTIVRGVNGTTAAVHANSTAMSRYVVPSDVEQLCIALAVAYYQAGLGGWTGVVGSGEAAVETRMKALDDMRQRVKRRYQRRLVGVV